MMKDIVIMVPYNYGNESFTEQVLKPGGAVTVFSLKMAMQQPSYLNKSV